MMCQCKQNPNEWIALGWKSGYTKSSPSPPALSGRPQPSGVSLLAYMLAEYSKAKGVKSDPITRAEP